jgi:hypothetical protein
MARVMDNATTSTLSPAVTETPSRPWRTVLLAFAATRIVVIVGVIIGARRGLRGIAGLTYYDSQWYFAIARDGYGAPPLNGSPSRWPFFPLYPALLRGLHVLGLGWQPAAVALSSAFALIGLRGLHELTRRGYGSRAGDLAVWACCAFPFSIVFSMGYVSGLVLATTVWAMLWVQDRRDLWAAVVLTAVVMARPNGVLMLLPIAALVLHSRSPGSRRRVLRLAAAPVLALAGWMALCQYWTGDALVFWHAKSAWDEITLLDIFPPALAPRPHLIAVVMAGATALWFGRRWTLPWGLWAAVWTVPSLVLGIVGLGRYINETAPLMAVTGVWLSTRSVAAQYALIATSAIGAITFSFLTIRHGYIP